MIRSLDKSRERNRVNLFTAEGLRECHLAAKAGYYFEKILYCPELISGSEIVEIFGEDHAQVITEVSLQVFNSLVYRKDIANCLAVIRSKYCALENLKIRHNGLILVIDTVEKPGNLGAMLRTADAAGVHAVIVCDPRTDIYNPNCIRSSLGTVFTNFVITTDALSCISWLKKNKIHTYITHLNSAVSYTEKDYRLSSAIVVGSEATGIQEVWLKNGFENIIIPQHGLADSLNVGASAAIVLFEALRQRNRVLK